MKSDYFVSYWICTLNLEKFSTFSSFNERNEGGVRENFAFSFSFSDFKIKAEKAKLIITSNMIVLMTIKNLH